METKLENRQQEANRHQATHTNTQRISHVLASLTIDGIRVLPDDSQYIPGRC